MTGTKSTVQYPPWRLHPPRNKMNKFDRSPKNVVTLNVCVINLFFDLCKDAKPFMKQNVDMLANN